MNRIFFFAILFITAFIACKKDEKTGPADSTPTGSWILAEYILLKDTPSNYTFNSDHTYSTIRSNVGESGTYQVKTTADPRIVELSLTKNGGGSYLLTIEKLSNTAIRIMADGKGFVFNRS